MKIINTKSFRLAINTRGNPKSAKLALLLPGRLDTKDYVCFEKNNEYLAEQGFLAVAFDPPGTWDSPGGIDLFTTTNYIKAVNELIEFFGNKPTLLLGHSRGAAVAIMVGASNPMVAGYIAIMSTYGGPSKPTAKEIERGFCISDRDVPPGTEKSKEQIRFNLPINYFIDGAKYDAAISLIKSFKPKLLFYGARDKFTKVEDAERLFRLAPEPKMIYKLDSDHDYRYHPDIIAEVNKVVGQFIKKYL